MDVPNNIIAILEDDLVTKALPLFFLAILFEWVYAAKKHLSWYERRDFLSSMGVLLLTGIIDLVPKILGIAAMFALYEISPLKGVFERQWWSWVLLFFLDDFVYYWFHRSNHELRFMWAGHVSHHSSQYLNYGTALRQGVGERVIKYAYWLPLPLLGFDPVMVVIMMTISLFYQFWIHTQAIAKLPSAIEYVFNTPSHHRVHHASNVRYLDCNHGGTLIIWDRLFGTFSEESPEEPVVYGLTHNLESGNVLTIAFREYRVMLGDMSRAERWSDKLRYLFMAPGWSHDGPDKRARTLRRKQQTSIA
ncbi:sterol desaturase family protein [gamma proteobacterium NOR5-3]|nr:sterol desaturase family protein [gamma proteobacterium NOR5-3]